MLLRRRLDGANKIKIRRFWSIKSEVGFFRGCNRIIQAITNIEKAKKILTELFPNIKSLNNDVREDLAEEFADVY